MEKRNIPDKKGGLFGLVLILFGLSIFATNILRDNDAKNAKEPTVATPVLQFTAPAVVPSAENDVRVNPSSVFLCDGSVERMWFAAGMEGYVRCNITEVDTSGNSVLFSLEFFPSEVDLIANKPIERSGFAYKITFPEN